MNELWGRGTQAGRSAKSSVRPVPHKDEPARERLLEQVLGPDTLLWYIPKDPRKYEVRRERDAKHIGFIEVSDKGEVVWLAKEREDPH